MDSTRNNGYVKVWRQIEQSAVWQAGEGVFQLWICLLVRATYKDRKVALQLGRHSVVVDLKPGQYVIRQRLLAEDLNVDRKTLRRRLDILQECECISIEPASRGLQIVTITNWEKYQSNDESGWGKNAQPGSDSGGDSGGIIPPLSDSGGDTGGDTGGAIPPHHKKNNKNKKKSIKRSSDDERARSNSYSKEFLEWWPVYPRKVAKLAAFNAYQKAAGKVGHDRLLETARAFAQSDIAQDRTYCPYPATWLNKGMYDDDPREWRRPNDNGKPQKTEELYPRYK